jgi:hypothetical protein
MNLVLNIITQAIEHTNSVMPDLIRHPVFFWVLAFARKPVNGKFSCRSNNH